MAAFEDLIIGIDLGTTNSCAAWVNNGKIDIIENKEERSVTPSFVYFVNAEKIIVGQQAISMSANKPEYGVYEIKRFMGRPYNANELKHSLSYLPFQVVENNGDCAVQILDHDIRRTPEEISSFVLQKIKQDATEKLGQAITKAVITVPAHFNVSQRKATLRAAEDAGFTVMKLLSEPTAAALNYFFDTKDKVELDNKYWLVYDLGGGTFDVAIAKTDVINNQQQINILCVDGDSNLGGHNFNNAIQDYFFQMHPVDDKVLSKRDLRRVRNQCNEAKEMLSTLDEVTISVEGLLGGQECVSVPLTQQKFDELCTALFEKSIQIVDRCLKKSGIEKQSINEVILVGGSTRIRKVQEMLVQYFEGKRLNQMLHPELCVAKGAALQAAMLSTNPQQKEQISHFKITEVTSSSLGIADIVNKFDVIISKNTPVPTSGSRTYITFEDKQEAMRLTVYEGEKLNVLRNVCLGTFSITNLSPLPPGDCKVKVFMNIDVNGILTVTAKEEHKSNTRDLEIALTPSKKEVDTTADLEDDDDKKFEEFANIKESILNYCEQIMYNITLNELANSHHPIHMQCLEIRQELFELVSVNDLDKIMGLGCNLIRLCNPLVAEFKFEDVPCFDGEMDGDNCPPITEALAANLKTTK